MNSRKIKVGGKIEKLILQSVRKEGIVEAVCKELGSEDSLEDLVTDH